MASDLRVYLVAWDGDSRVVEAESLSAAVDAWLSHMREEWAASEAEESPHSVSLLSDEPVIRAVPSWLTAPVAAPPASESP